MTRAEELALEQRANDMQRRRVIDHWHSLAAKHRASWRQSIQQKSMAQFAFMRSIIHRWHAISIAPDRPSVQRRIRSFMDRKSTEFRKYKDRSNALQQWRRMVIVGKDYAAKDENARELWRRHQLLSTWRCWQDVVSRHQAATAASASHRLVLLRRLLHRSFARWRSSQESSVLERVQSSIARKHAYKSELRRRLRAWTREAGRAEERERKAAQYMEARTRRQLEELWEAWRGATHRQIIFGAIAQRRCDALIAQAQRSTLRSWRNAMLELRHEAQLFSMADRLHHASLRHAAVHRWRHWLRMTRVVQLMGVTSYSLLARKWARWRQALAAKRAERRLQSQAHDHWAHQQLHQAVSTWRRIAISHKATSIMSEQALHHRHTHDLCTAISRWRLYAHDRTRRRELSIDASLFRRQHAFLILINQLRSVVSEAAQTRLARRAQQLHLRRRALTRWRLFTAEQVHAYESHLLAKRTVYKRTLRRVMHAWISVCRQERRVEDGLMQSRGGMMMRQRLREVLWKHWRRATAAHRMQRLREDMATQLYRTTLLQEAFGVWRAQFQQTWVERQKRQMSVRHARLTLLARMFAAWGHYVTVQYSQGGGMRQRLQYFQSRLATLRRFRLFDHWRARLESRLRRAELRRDADAFRARWIIHRIYHRWRRALQARLAEQRRIALVSRLHARRCMHDVWSRWRLALRMRRHALHKNVLALRFWCRRVQRRAWNGWSKYHAMQLIKKDMMEKAMRMRRDHMRKAALRAWIGNGVDLHETSLLIVQRTNPSAFLNVRSRRLACKYALLWRYKVMRHLQQDQSRGMGWNRRLVNLLPLASTSAPHARHNRAPPLPVPDEREEEENKEQPQSSHATVPSSTPHLAIPQQGVRPPPRRPLELLIDQPLHLPSQSMALALSSMMSRPLAPLIHPPPSSLPARNKPSMSIPMPVFTSSDVARSLADFVPDLPIPPSTISTFGSAAPLHYQQDARGEQQIQIDMPTSDSHPRMSDMVSEQQISALEDHLHRLMEWKKEARQRRIQLQQLQQTSTSLSLEQQHRLHELQRSVASDVEHRPYWQEQVEQVQKQISQLMHDAAT